MDDGESFFARHILGHSSLRFAANSLEKPMLWSMYWLNYLDRNAIALARLNDLEDDLNLTDTRESTTTNT